MIVEVGWACKGSKTILQQNVWRKSPISTTFDYLDKWERRQISPELPPIQRKIRILPNLGMCLHKSVVCFCQPDVLTNNPEGLEMIAVSVVLREMVVVVEGPLLCPLLHSRHILCFWLLDR